MDFEHDGAALPSINVIGPGSLGETVGRALAAAGYRAILSPPNGWSTTRQR